MIFEDEVAELVNLDVAMPQLKQNLKMRTLKDVSRGAQLLLDLSEQELSFARLWVTWSSPMTTAQNGPIPNLFELPS